MYLINHFRDCDAVLQVGQETQQIVLAFLAVGLKLPIIDLSEEQQSKLKKDFAGQLKKYTICDPLSVEEAKQIDDICSTVAINTL